MNFCLPKGFIDKFDKAMESGKFDPIEFSSVSNEERIKTLSEIFNDLPESDSKTSFLRATNALFEEKIASSEVRFNKVLDKNAEKGITGLSDKQAEKLIKLQREAFDSVNNSLKGLDPKVDRSLAARIVRLGDLLAPESKDLYLKDMVSKKLGLETSFEEAKTISELSKEFESAKKLPVGDVKYGSTRVALDNFMTELGKPPKVGLKETLTGVKKDPWGSGRNFIEKLAGFAKGMKASFDNSVLFNPGLKVLTYSPKTWIKNAPQSFLDILKAVTKRDAKGGFSGIADTHILDAVKAEGYSRINARNGWYDGLGIELAKEEPFTAPHVIEKIPILNRLYNASEIAYTSFLYRSRMDIADILIPKMIKDGIELGDKEAVSSVGRFINDTTGRGNLGTLEKNAKTINLFLFSGKKMAANIALVTKPFGLDVFGKPVSAFARKEATKSLLGMVGTIVTTMGIAEALHPGAVELDPRSANFGKIKIGNTRFDVSQGVSSILTLAARIFSASSKSSTTGKVTQLGSGFGKTPPADLLWNFTENKLSPLAGLFKDIINREDFNHQPLTVGGETYNLLSPLGAQSTIEAAQDPSGANALIVYLADSLGINANTYGLQKKHK